MRTKILYIVLIILFGCKGLINNDLGGSQELNKTFIEASDECVEAIWGKEDELLGNFKKLDNYIWNPKKLTATISISETKTLKINLSGCNEVLKECQFIVPSGFMLENNSNEIKQDFLWVSKLICEEGVFNQIKNLLEDLSMTSWKTKDNKNLTFLIPSNLEENQEETIMPVIAVFEKGLNNNSYKITYLAN